MIFPTFIVVLALFSLLVSGSFIDERANEIGKFLNRKIPYGMKKPVQEVAVAPSTYVVINEYVEDDTICSTVPLQQIGLAMNTCLVQSAATSMSYVGVLYGDGSINVVTNYYATAGNCTGASTSSNILTPTACMDDTANKLRSKWTVSQYSTDPWKNIGSGSGIVSQVYPSADACGLGGSGNTYIYHANTQCIPAGDGSGYSSIMYATCSETTGLAYNTYKDANCQEFIKTQTSLLPKCLATTSNGLPAWLSMTCKD